MCGQLVGMSPLSRATQPDHHPLQAGIHLATWPGVYWPTAAVTATTGPPYAHAMPAIDRRILLWVLTAIVVVEAIARCVITAATSGDEAATLFTAIGSGLLASVVVAASWRAYPQPVLAAWVGFGGSAAVELFSYAALADSLMLWSGFALLAVPYMLGRHSNTVGIFLGAIPMAISIGVAVWVEAYNADTTINSSDASGAAVLLALCVAIGLVARHRNDAQQSLRLSAQTKERERLARDLHDTVAHRVSAVTIQAQAGQALLRHGDVSGAAKALAAIESESASALDEMRAVVGALREPDFTPCRYNVAELADPHALIPVHVTCRGTASGHPADVEEAVYRIVQESISNVRRHAVNATEIVVTVDYSPTGVALSIADDGNTSSKSLSHGGFGIMGMQERVAGFGGTLDAGPSKGNGWVVSAHIPKQHPDKATEKLAKK